MKEEAKSLEQQGKVKGFETSKEQILSEGHNSDPQEQTHYDECTLSLCSTAALNAWDRIQELGTQRIESYIRVKQGQREPFTDFLQRLTKSVQLGVTDCQMDVFHFAEFGKLNMYTTLLTLFLGFQWATNCFKFRKG